MRAHLSRCKLRRAIECLLIQFRCLAQQRAGAAVEDLLPPDQLSRGGCISPGCGAAPRRYGGGLLSGVLHSLQSTQPFDLVSEPLLRLLSFEEIHSPVVLPPLHRRTRVAWI